MSAEIEVNNLLKSSGAVLKRDHKHEVWELPDGKNFVRAKTPSDRRSGMAELRTLKKLLGVDEVRGLEGERREKNVKTKAPFVPAKFEPKFNSTLAEQLSTTGIVESRLRDEITMLEYEGDLLRDEIADQQTELSEVWALFLASVTRPCSCWWCRLVQRFGWEK